MPKDVVVVVSGHQEGIEAIWLAGSEETRAAGVENDVYSLALAPGVTKDGYMGNSALTEMVFTLNDGNAATMFSGKLPKWNDRGHLFM
jgi:hypothetical protein